MAIKISKNRLDMGSTPIKNVQYLDVDQVTTPAAPATGKTRFYSKTGGALYVIPAAGSETAVSSSIPANLVAYFNGAVASIPSGWTEFTAARGRVIVGVPLAGTVGGTVGTALTNVEDRTHTHTGPSHQHLTGMGAGWDVAGFSYTSGYGLYSSIDHSSANYRVGTAAGSTGVYDFYTNASGTGATGTAATSNVVAYIQQPAIVKS